MDTMLGVGERDSRAKALRAGSDIRLAVSTAFRVCPVVVVLGYPDDQTLWSDGLVEVQAKSLLAQALQSDGHLDPVQRRLGATCGLRWSSLKSLQVSLPVFCTSR